MGPCSRRRRPQALCFFFEGDGVEHKFDAYGQQVVATSMGHIDTRYTIKTVVKLKGRRIRATFTIADRSTQVYPVLIGRNVLRGKFVVDVQFGKSLKAKEKTYQRPARNAGK